MWTVGAAPGQGSGPSSASRALCSCGQAPSPGSQSSKSGPGESGLQALRLLPFGILVSELQGSEAILDKLRSQIFWLLCSWPNGKLQVGPHVMNDLGLWQRPESQLLGRN